MSKFKFKKRGGLLTSPMDLPRLQSVSPPKKKKKILVWSDYILSTTGFGTVSKHVLSALHKTGEYEIHQLAINYFGEFQDAGKVPYSIVPAKSGDPADVYGEKIFLHALQTKEYDYVLIINDTFVVNNVAGEIEKIRGNLLEAKRKVPIIVYYYPVDCKIIPHLSKMIEVADYPVAYTNFARDCSIREGEQFTPSHVIYHGADIHNFYPISEEERRECRKRYIQTEDDDTFIMVNVNRNSLRKDMARTLLAFSRFKEEITSNCKLYLHCKIIDGTGQGIQVDLTIPLSSMSYETKKDVVFPRNFSPVMGFPVHVLNQLYNCGDLFISTHLGEGWGLSQVDAMAAGVPVLLPNNTSTPEILGTDRGYIYECKEHVYQDNSGYRPFGRMEDILEQMKIAYEDWRTGNPRRQEMIQKARAFTKKYSWEAVGQQWVDLFKHAKHQKLKLATEGEEL